MRRPALLLAMIIAVSVSNAVVLARPFPGGGLYAGNGITTYGIPYHPGTEVVSITGVARNDGPDLTIRSIDVPAEGAAEVLGVDVLPEDAVTSGQFAGDTLERCGMASLAPAGSVVASGDALIVSIRYRTTGQGAFRIGPMTIVYRQGAILHRVVARIIERGRVEPAAKMFDRGGFRFCPNREDRLPR